MADFTRADIEGANELLNKTLTDALALKDSLLAEHGGDATNILNAVKDKVADLKSSLSSMIPELPTIPNANMQSEFATLVNLDLNTPAGVEQYKSQVLGITNKFGTAMADKGLDIDSLATEIQSGVGDVGDLLPNLQIPDGLTIPIELPSNIKIPSAEAIKEKITVTPTLQLATKEIEVVTDEVSGMTKVTTTSTESTSTTTTPKTVTSTSTKKLIKVSETGGETVTVRSRNADGSLYDADAANERRFQSERALRTRIPGHYTSAGGTRIFLQRYTDEKIDKLKALVNGIDTDQLDKATGKVKEKFLSGSQTRRYFSSYTYDDGGRTDESFLEARDMGDWEWKEDDNGFLWYDRRFKKHRLT